SSSIILRLSCVSFLLSCVFNHTLTTALFTLSLHDALPISSLRMAQLLCTLRVFAPCPSGSGYATTSKKVDSATQRSASRLRSRRSEEHTSELQSPDHLVCRLLLAKTKPRPAKLAEFRRRIG